MNGVPTLAAKLLTSDTCNGGPSGSLSAPEPLSANTLPVPAVSSGVVTASGCATGASSTGLTLTVVVMVSVSLPLLAVPSPSTSVQVIVRSPSVGLSPPVLVYSMLCISAAPRSGRRWR